MRLVLASFAIPKVAHDTQCVRSVVAFHVASVPAGQSEQVVLLLSSAASGNGQFEAT